MNSITHVISDLDPVSGGTVSALVGLAIQQRRNDIDVRVVTVTSGKTNRREIDRLKASGVKVFECSPIGRLRSIGAIRMTLGKSMVGADWVQVHGMWEEIQYQAMRLSCQMEIPYVVSPHGMLDPWSLSQSRIKKWLYLTLRMRTLLNRAWAIHCTTPTEARLLGPLGLQPKNIVIPNGIDLDEFDSASAGTAAQGFLERFVEIEGRPIVLFLARLHPKKGLELLLPAFAALEANAVLILAGPCDEKYKKTILKLVNELHLEKKVIFTGMLHGEQRVGALCASDVFVLPSYQENFGIAVIEALASGTPVAISDQVNIAKQIENRDVGIVFELEIEQIRAAISDLLRSQSKMDCRAVASEYGFSTIAALWAASLVADGKQDDDSSSGPFE